MRKVLLALLALFALTATPMLYAEDLPEIQGDESTETLPPLLMGAMRFGLAAAVWTNDVRRAHRVAHALKAGGNFQNLGLKEDPKVTENAAAHRGHALADHEQVLVEGRLQHALDPLADLLAVFFQPVDARLDQGAADAGHPEDLLGDDGTAEQACEVEAGHGLVRADQRVERKRPSVVLRAPGARQVEGDPADAGGEVAGGVDAGARARSTCASASTRTRIRRPTSSWVPTLTCTVSPRVMKPTNPSAASRSGWRRRT